MLDPTMPSIFAIADIHLPVQTQVLKFGVPPDYFHRISQYLLLKNPEVLLIAGDLVWGDDIRNVQAELSQIKSLPSKIKFFIEGNHDLWVDRLGDSYFETQQQMYDRFSTPSFFYIGGRASIITLDVNNAIDGMKKDPIKIGICGARGFAFDPNKSPTGDDFILRNSELESLDQALSHLKALLETEDTLMNFCIVHFPPTTQIFSDHRSGDEEFLQRIQNSGIIDRVVFGHVHVDDYLRLYTRLNHLELFCATTDRRNYGAVKVFDSKTMQF